MKNKSSRSAVPFEPFTDDDVRDYAYHLYVQTGCIPDRDLDNWLEAKACLRACIPKSESQTRLHRHARDKQQPAVAASTATAA